MRKRIISLLLVMVLTLTMTACVANTDAKTATSEPTISATVAPTESEDLVELLWHDDIEKMNSEEISDYISEMVKISESKNLSLEDMQNMAWNFGNIWEAKNYPSGQEAEIKKQFSTAFNNIYAQTIDQQIPLDTLTAWTYVPDADVMCKYLSSTNFYEPDMADCYTFGDLSKEDKTRVAEAFFKNSLLSFNTSVPNTIVCHSPSQEVTDMAWEHFVTLSKSTDSRLSGLYHSQRVLVDIFCKTSGYQDTQKLVEIEKNILENTNYAFLLKYSFFLWYLEDENLFNVAFDTLLELAQNADDEETIALIKELTEILDDEHARKLLSALENHYIDT